MNYDDCLINAQFKRGAAPMAKIPVTQHYSVTTLHKQSVSMSEADWDRLRQMVDQIIPQRQIFQVLASILLGTAGSTILSLIGLWTASGLKTWVFPTMWAVLAASLVVGAALLWIDQFQKKMSVFTREMILHEMARLEEADEPGQVPGDTTAKRLSKRLEAERQIKSGEYASSSDIQKPTSTGDGEN